MRFAAIDIGSNAVRLLISEAEGNEERPKKLKLLRIPVRLGFDTFLHGRISEARLANLERTIKIYKLMMEIYEVKDYKACATSAMRDAENHQEIIERIKADTSLEIEVISGDEEAAIIYDTHIADIMDPAMSYLYIDVGGGSTELTLFSHHEKTAAASFNIGTIRLLNKQVHEDEWNAMKHWIKEYAQEDQELLGIGSGGNINTIFQLSRRKMGRPLTLDYIKEFCKEVSEHTIEERIRVYNMKPDRADVIMPACRIFQNVMKWGNIRNIYVPQIGLVDGIIHSLAEKHHMIKT